MVAARSAVPTILVLGLLLLDAVGTVSSRKVRPRSPQEDVDSAGPTTVVDKLVADINAGNVPVRQCDPADPDGSGCDAEEKGMIERIVSSLGNDPVAVSKAIDPFRAAMGDPPADPQRQEAYVKQRKQMVQWLGTELGIEINRGGMAERIVRWTKVTGLLDKISAAPVDPAVAEQTNREL